MARRLLLLCAVAAAAAGQDVPPVASTGTAATACADEDGVVASDEQGREYRCSEASAYCGNAALAAKCRKTCGLCSDGALLGGAGGFRRAAPERSEEPAGAAGESPATASAAREIAAAVERAAEGAAALPLGWGQGSRDGKAFYYPVDAPERVQWDRPSVPLPSAAEIEAVAASAAAEKEAAAKVVAAEGFRVAEALRVEQNTAAAKARLRVEQEVVTVREEEAGAAGQAKQAAGCGDAGCGEHGICIARACSCSDGYFGEGCTSPPDPCFWPVKVQCLGSSRCVGGECVRGAADSAAGETGLCGGVDCGRRGRCVDGACSCEEGWGGLSCADRNECVTAPCKNGGTCFESGDVLDELGAAHAQLAEAWRGGFRCVCMPGFMGDACQCMDCGDHGTCLRNGMCHCQKGWEGSRCRKDSDECASNPCNKHGDCIDGNNRYTCSCHVAYDGFWCERVLPPPPKLDECSSSPCGMHGACVIVVATVEAEGQYFCECSSPWAGENCETFTFRGSGSQYKAEL